MQAIEPLCALKDFFSILLKMLSYCIMSKNYVARQFLNLELQLTKYSS